LSLLVRRQNRVRRVEWIRTVLSVGVNQEYGQQPRVGDQVLEKGRRKKELRIEVISRLCRLLNYEVFTREEGE
jgi:hypothetical protein